MRTNPKYGLWGRNILRTTLLLTTFLLCQVHSSASANKDTVAEEINITQDGKKQVKGKVVDQSGLVVPGVSIIIKGTATGTISDIDGNFSISVAPDEILKFSFIGMQTRELTVGVDNFDTVTLIEDIVGINEVVVVGYGTMERKEVTSAVETIDAKNFVQNGSSDPMELIQGKVAGLNITRTEGSNPNSRASIQLRGVTSLTGTRQPLIVIDGIPGGNLDMVRQEDIASFNVLKDGSAAAIYGSRANAGVILITTKKGKEGKAQFNYSTYFTREFVDKKPDYLSASKFRSLIKKGLISADQDLGSSTDLYDELIDKDNLTQYHSFSAAGGSKNTNYRASVYYNDACGIARQNSREEFGGRINVNQTGLNDKLTMSMNLATNFNNANLLGGRSADFAQAIQRNPTMPIRNEDGTFYNTEAHDAYNPMSRLANRINKRDQQMFTGDMKLQYQVLNGLSVSAFAAYQRNTYNDREYRSKDDWEQRPSSQYQGMGFARKYNYLAWSKTFESTINYIKELNDHTIKALGGYSYQYGTVETFDAQNNGFTTDGFLDWNLGAGSAINNDKLPKPGMGSHKHDNTLVAFFGRVNYSFKRKYHFQASLRHEGSSRFGENNKWGSFPAFSGGWTITEESFMDNLTQVNELKLRVGYGITGNQGIPNYQSLITLGTGGVYPQNGVYYETYGAARNPNANLKWEEKAELNFGLDFALFDNILSGSLDIYQRKTSNLLYEYNAQQPSYVRDRLYTNVGTLKSNGIELQLSAIAMQKQDFRWTVDFTANTQKNELTKLSNDVFKANWLEYARLTAPGNLGAAIRLEEGGKIGNFYGKRFAGLTEEGKWLFYKKDGTKGKASEMTEDDLCVIGNGVPKLQASLGNTFKYKNFDLSIHFRGKFGFDILNTKELYLGNKKYLPNNILNCALSKHKKIDDDPQYSDYYIEKGDFVKIDNLTLGYNMNIKKSSWVRNLRVYVTGRNLATFTGYDGIDPELQDTGFEPGVDNRGFYPRTQSWTVGLKVGF